MYYGTESPYPPYVGTGLIEGDSPIDVGNATHFDISSLPAGVYYFSVVAYDVGGRVGWYSTPVDTLYRTALPALRK